MLAAQTTADRQRALAMPVRVEQGAVADTLAALLAQDPDARVRAKAARLLSQVRGPQAVAGLTDALEDPDRSVRLVAVQFYPKVQSAEQAIQALSAVLAQDPDTSVRRQAASTLGQLRSEQVPTALAAGASDADPQVRDTVRKALAKWEQRRAAPR